MKEKAAATAAARGKKVAESGGAEAALEGGLDQQPLYKSA